MRFFVAGLLISLVCAANIPAVLNTSYVLRILQVKHQMFEQLEKESLVSISIPEKDIQWLEEDKELVVNGRYFDVKSICKKNGQFLITGLFDDVEKSLAAKASDNFEKQKNKTIEAHATMVIFCFYPMLHQPFILEPTAMKNKQVQHNLIPSALLSYYSAPWQPPCFLA